MNIRGNLYCLYLVKTAKWFSLIMPVIVLFYKDNGLSMHEIFVLRSVYSVAIVVLEIPSGYLADRFGRKLTLQIGAIAGFVGYIIYSASFSFYTFLFAEIILGIGQSLISGSDSAILYDTLLSANKQDRYSYFEGRIISIGNFAEAVAGIAGGLIAAVSLRYSFIGQAIVAFTAIPAAFLLTEPAARKNTRSGSFKDIFIAISVHLKSRSLILYTLFSAVTGVATLTMAWFIQPWFSKAGIPVAMFGVLWTALNLSVAITSLKSHGIQQKAKRHSLLLFFVIVFPVGYILAGLLQSVWAIVFLFVFYFSRGIATPVLKDYLQQQISPEVRATILSIRNFAIRLAFAVTGPVLGYITDVFSLSTALICTGMILFPAYIIIYHKIRKEKY